MLFIGVIQAQCVVSYPTPISNENSSLKWAVRFSTSYRDAPSVPAVSDGYLAVMKGKQLLKVSGENGDVIDTADMTYSAGFGYVPPTIYGDIVYCPVLYATVEAFSFDSMTKLWSYSDELGGQSLTKVVYDGGFIFTGFWNEEDETAAYVCLNASTGELIWRFEHKGGFYWADCAVIGDYVVFGGDDGTVYDDRPSEIFSLNKLTGEVCDRIGVNGDIRAGIVYREENGRVYTVSKSGYLYSISFDNGKFGDIQSVCLGGASTSTPAICNGRVYVGVQTEVLKGNISVIDAETLEIIYTAETPGYPQSEMLISDFYGNKVFIYATYNAVPGGIIVMTDSENQTFPEIYQLFSPEGGRAGYSISMIAADEKGTLYYKNDSGYIFAVENTINFGNIQDFFAKLYSIMLTLLEFLNEIFI